MQYLLAIIILIIICMYMFNKIFVNNQNYICGIMSLFSRTEKVHFWSIHSQTPFATPGNHKSCTDVSADGIFFILGYVPVGYNQ